MIGGVGRLIGAVVLFFVVVIGIVFIAGGASWLTAPFRGAVEQREIVQADGRYRIAAYEKFYDDCAAVQALEDQIAAMKANKSLPESQRETNVLALTNARNTLIRNYNADSRKADTIENFKASDLPYQLDPQKETTCSA